jgi:hypothetical protein
MRLQQRIQTGQWWNATKIVILLKIPILLASYNVDVKKGTLGTANFQFVFLIAL